MKKLKSFNTYFLNEETESDEQVDKKGCPACDCESCEECDCENCECPECCKNKETKRPIRSHEYTGTRRKVVGDEVVEKAIYNESDSDEVKLKKLRAETDKLTKRVEKEKGRKSKATGKPVHENVDFERKQELIDVVIEELKKDFEHGDYTILEEVLGFVPIENLIHSLSEDRWDEFSDLKEI